MTILDQLVYKITGDTSAFNTSIDSTETKVSKFSKVATTALTALSVGAIAGVTKKMLNLAEQSATTLDTIDKMSQKIGISTEAYQEWDFILSQSGASVSGLQTSMKTLSTAASEAADGTAEYKDEFDRLGISAVDTNGNLKDSETLFNEVFAALSDMEDETQRTATASKLLGRSATELAPALNSSSEEIESMREQAHDLGLVMNDEAVAAGVALTDSLDQLRRKFTTLKTEAMLPIINTMNTVISKVLGQDEASADLEGTYGDLKTAITNYNDVLEDAEGKTDAVTQAMVSQAKAALNLALQKAQEAYSDANKDLEKFNNTITKGNKWIEKYESSMSKMAEGTGYTTDELNKMTEQERNQIIATTKGVETMDAYNTQLIAREEWQKAVFDATVEQSKAEQTEAEFVNVLTQGYLDENEATKLLLDTYPELKDKVLDNVDAYKAELEAKEAAIEAANKEYENYTSNENLRTKASQSYINLANAKIEMAKSSEEAEIWEKLLAAATEDLNAKQVANEKTTEELAEKQDARQTILDTLNSSVEQANKLEASLGDNYDENTALSNAYLTAIEDLLKNGEDPQSEKLKELIGLYNELNPIVEESTEVVEALSDTSSPNVSEWEEWVNSLKDAVSWVDTLDAVVSNLTSGMGDALTDVGEAIYNGEDAWAAFAAAGLDAMSDILTTLGDELAARAVVSLLGGDLVGAGLAGAGSTAAYVASGVASAAAASYEVGTIDVPNDMTANIHKGEIILPQGIAEEARQEGISITPNGSSGGNNFQVIVQLGEEQIVPKIVKVINKGGSGTISKRVVK